MFNQLLKHITKKEVVLSSWSLYVADKNSTNLYPSNQHSDQKCNHKPCEHKYSKVKSQSK